MKHPTLFLPKINPRIEYKAGIEYIFDSIRKKFLVLTPEEWVRQHFVQLLTVCLGYPPGIIQLERQHNYGNLAKRSDILVFDKEGNSFLLVECKSYNILINETTLKQISTYNKILKSRYIAISNGMKHFIWKLSGDAYVQITEFPKYGS